MSTNYPTPVCSHAARVGFRDVYEPSEDSFFRIDVLEKDAERLQLLRLDTHTSSGSPAQVESLLPRLRGKVDVLLFNPPYVVTPSEEVQHLQLTDEERLMTLSPPPGGRYHQVPPGLLGRRETRTRGDRRVSTCGGTAGYWRVTANSSSLPSLRTIQVTCLQKDYNPEKVLDIQTVPSLTRGDHPSARGTRSEWRGPLIDYSWKREAVRPALPSELTNRRNIVST